MSNTIWAMRLLQQLQRGPQPALLPLTTAEPEREPRSRGSRSRRSPSPDRRRSKASKRSPPPRRRRARSPSSSSEEDKAYGSPSESDYSSYDEPEQIKERYSKEPCEYVSPAGLRDKKSKKEVVNYLEEKQCPKIETHAKKRKHVPPNGSSAPAPAPSAPAPPPPAAPDHPNPPAPVPPPPSAVKDSIAAPKKLGRPKKPIDPNAKPKRAPTAYNLAVSKYRKEGLSMADASKRAKEDTKKPE